MVWQRVEEVKVNKWYVTHMYYETLPSWMVVFWHCVTLRSVYTW